ncbi:hypothetical protein [Methylobacterium haplocladii]|uniref:Uncharacterized protein n=1 Tax=Methylobacterium haplocladii TaxID=1176176 RepID=A0A512IKL5_9HYPH|nr:hypothetical protein [Methylobacterium haplocladii]GEO98267.1 hypothetical protein MHA02_06550 [Methylobacterium haplocladii]GJD84338.1 IS1595 family transposase ISMph1 [Methylobacterium haplocladii]GLS58439.1 hypothetical protein GCM10007887_10990 [Methylobacterium haplocladii]
MALPQVVTTLRAKRDQVEAHIAELRRQLDAAERDLSSLTAVLSLYDLSPGTQTRFPAYAHLNRLFAYGEMFKLCKRALEEAGKPLTTREIALAVIRMKGWDDRDMMLRKAVAYRLIQNLSRACQQGRISDAGWRSNVRLWKLRD